MSMSVKGLRNPMKRRSRMHIDKTVIVAVVILVLGLAYFKMEDQVNIVLGFFGNLIGGN